MPYSRADRNHFRNQAQEALDELWAEHVIPFKLIAYKVDRVSIRDHRYRVHFFDARLPEVIVEWTPGISFKDLVRIAVLGYLTPRDLAE